MAYFQKQTGAWGEDLAERFLRNKGYKIIARNLRSKAGEIDILARKRDILVVAEVKTKSGDELGQGWEMVNYFKRKKLVNLAKSLQIKYPKCVIRIDIISIDAASTPPAIEHFENAVEEILS
jgi:putative endonuclease